MSCCSSHHSTDSGDSSKQQACIILDLPLLLTGRQTRKSAEPSTMNAFTRHHRPRCPLPVHQSISPLWAALLPDHGQSQRAMAEWLLLEAPASMIRTVCFDVLACSTPMLGALQLFPPPSQIHANSTLGLASCRGVANTMNLSMGHSEPRSRTRKTP